MTEAEVLYEKIVSLTNQIGTLGEQLDIITKQWQDAMDADEPKVVSIDLDLS